MTTAADIKYLQENGLVYIRSFGRNDTTPIHLYKDGDNLLYFKSSDDGFRMLKSKSYSDSIDRCRLDILGNSESALGLLGIGESKIQVSNKFVHFDFKSIDSRIRNSSLAPFSS